MSYLKQISIRLIDMAAVAVSLLVPVIIVHTIADGGLHVAAEVTVALLAALLNAMAYTVLYTMPLNRGWSPLRRSVVLLIFATNAVSIVIGMAIARVLERREQ